jgi:rsbT co-antagonist protein RsbR
MQGNRGPMDVDSSQGRMAAYLRDHEDKIVDRWTELVVAGLRGRSSATEVRRELEDLSALLIRVMSGGDEQASGELRATLAELSRSRARNGFTPGEKAR